MAPTSTVAVLLQLNETSLWPEFAAWLGNLGAALISRRDIPSTAPPFALYVHFNMGLTATQDIWRTRDLVLRDYPAADFTEHRNAGADMSGFLCQLALIEAKDITYDVVFKVHTKMSVYLHNESWRDSLIMPLMGTPTLAGAAIDAFADPKVGVAASFRWAEFPVEDLDAWLGGPHTKDILRAYVIRDGCYFVAGSMFAIRGRILRDWVARTKGGTGGTQFLRGEIESFRDGRHARDGEKCHAYERALPMMAQLSGYKVHPLTF